MTINVLNIGPKEWFSPHFTYTDNKINSFEFDPLKQPLEDIKRFVELYHIDALNIFRSDLLSPISTYIREIPSVEWSTEIYPLCIKRNCFKFNAIEKFFHCLKDIDSSKNIIHYDSSRTDFLNYANISHKCHILPVNLEYINRVNRDIDVLFFGRSSSKRYKYLSRLKELGIKFVWIENGLSFNELAKFINRSKVVVNLTAEDLDNFEPRILIAVAYGCLVVTENSHGLYNYLLSTPKEIQDRIYVYEKSDIDDFIGNIFLSLSNYSEHYFSDLFSSNNTFLDCLLLSYD